MHKHDVYHQDPSGLTSGVKVTYDPQDRVEYVSTGVTVPPDLPSVPRCRLSHDPSQEPPAETETDTTRHTHSFVLTDFRGRHTGSDLCDPKVDRVWDWVRSRKVVVVQSLSTCPSETSVLNLSPSVVTPAGSKKVQTG